MKIFCVWSQLKSNLVLVAYFLMNRNKRTIALMIAGAPYKEFFICMKSCRRESSGVVKKSKAQQIDSERLWNLIWITASANWSSLITFILIRFFMFSIESAVCTNWRIFINVLLTFTSFDISMKSNSVHRLLGPNLWLRDFLFSTNKELKGTK